MKILIIHLGTVSECFVATSILKGLRNKYNRPIIDVIVKTEPNRKVFKYNKYIRRCFAANKAPEEKYDLIINLHPSIANVRNLSYLIDNSKELRGLIFDDKTENLKQIVYGNKPSFKNLFQIYHNMSGLKWQGESYDFYYKPRNRSQKNRTGIAVVNANLRQYIIDELQLSETRIWNVPIKRDLFKRLDEINRCKHIVTDDFLTMNCSLYLRKDVKFLQTYSYNFKLEFFNSGEIIKVPANFVL